MKIKQLLEVLTSTDMMIDDKLEKLTKVLQESMIRIKRFKKVGRIIGEILLMAWTIISTIL